MDNNSYFKNLISLYNNSKPDSLKEDAMPVSQNKIADKGSDVNPQNQPEEVYGDDMPENADEEQENDATLMQQDLPAQPQELDSTKTLEKEKFVKLFSFYEDLLNYGKVFSDSLETIDINLLDTDVFMKYQAYSKNVKELVEKIRDYLEDVFNTETYDKVLYTYILYRTEMITIIKNLRKVLKLDEVQNDDEKDSKNSD